jgi:hypothetical protein
MLLGASQAAAWLHAASVSHVTCLEHGESVHGAASATDAERQAPDADGTSRTQAAPEAAESHDHCTSGALLRWRDVALTAPATTGQLTVSERPLPRVATHEAAPASVVYLLAPKTSPPRSAV